MHTDWALKQFFLAVLGISRMLLITASKMFYHMFILTNISTFPSRLYIFALESHI